MLRSDGYFGSGQAYFHFAGTAAAAAFSISSALATRITAAFISAGGFCRGICAVADGNFFAVKILYV